MFLLTHATTPKISTLSLHDALPICAFRFARQSPPSSRSVSRVSPPSGAGSSIRRNPSIASNRSRVSPERDRKSTRLNSSHVEISYAVFCLKKKQIMNSLQHQLLYLM